MQSNLDLSCLPGELACSHMAMCPEPKGTLPMDSGDNLKYTSLCCQILRNFRFFFAFLIYDYLMLQKPLFLPLSAGGDGVVVVPFPDGISKTSAKRNKPLCKV